MHFASGYHRIDLRSGTNRSWVVSILPHLEQQQLFSQFDPKLHVAANLSGPQLRQPQALLCPSEEALGRKYLWRSVDEEQVSEFAKANYAAYVGPFHTDDFYSPGAIKLYGQRLKEVTDGVSQTLALSELRTRDHEFDQRGAWALPWAAASLLSLDAHPLWYDALEDQEELIYPEFIFSPSSVGRTQSPNSKWGDVLYDCPDLAAEQIERMPCVKEGGYISASPRSNHTAGVNAAFLDGSVHFITNEIDEETLAHLICTADGQTAQLP
jgi:prepilin-type processing-associated H-X9-DG protein